MGTETRKVVLDGLPGSRVIGCDIEPRFIDAGYKLYDDRATTGISFFVDDIFKLDPIAARGEMPAQVALHEVKSLNELKGRMTYIYAGALFHLFDEKSQQAIAERLATLMKVPSGGSIGDAPVAGCIIFGKQQALESHGVIDKVLGRSVSFLLSMN